MSHPSLLSEPLFAIFRVVAAADDDKCNLSSFVSQPLSFLANSSSCSSQPHRQQSPVTDTLFQIEHCTQITFRSSLPIGCTLRRALLEQSCVLVGVCCALCSLLRHQPCEQQTITQVLSHSCIAERRNRLGAPRPDLGALAVMRESTLLLVVGWIHTLLVTTAQVKSVYKQSEPGC